MSPLDTKPKARKGTVQIKVSNDRLQLVFSYSGKRHYISLGIPDSKANRKAAEAKAKLIESDIALDRFDLTLTRYKPQKSDVPTVTPNFTPSLGDLWVGFLAYKQPQCSPNTMDIMYGQYTRYLEKLPTQDLQKAIEIRDFAIKRFPTESAKRFIVRLSACCDWGIKSGTIDQNPFKGMASEIKLPKAKNGMDDINPFSKKERDLIIQSIESDQFQPDNSGFKHSYYTNFVRFLFTTGCRHSEALALQWKHVSPDLTSITFEQAVIDTIHGHAVRQGLKTQERRRFPCNESLRNLLKSIRSEGTDPEDYLFPGVRGGILNINAFRRNVWKRVLKETGIEYRKLYQTRHTFITLALENGLDAKDVARLVGNSPEVIYRHYAGNKHELFVPEF